MGKLDSVGQQVADYLAETYRITGIDATHPFLFHIQNKSQSFRLGYRTEAPVYFVKKRTHAEGHVLYLHLPRFQSMKIKQTVHQRKDMIGRSSHIFQIITLPFVRTTAQQQFYITDYGRERRTDIVADRQHQLLPAMEQVFGILLGFLQLLPVILAPGDITRDQNDKDHHDNQRQDSDAANEIRGFAQHLLFLHDTLHRRVHLLFFYIAQHLVDPACDDTVIIT